MTVHAPRTPRVDIDYDRTPRDFFFAPGIDRGLWTTAPLPPMWTTRPQARVAAAAVGAHPPHAEQVTRHVDTHHRRRTFRSALELATVPVVLEGLEAEGHFLSVGGKYLLTGAAGTRLRNRFAWYADAPEAADAATVDHFAELSAADPVPPVWDGPIDGLDFVIDARNPFNFYHFATEALCLLCAVDDDAFTGRVFVHCDRAGVKPFIRAWVDALFPRLAGRVRFRSGRARYGRCLSVLNARHLYFQTGPSAMPDMDAEAPGSHFWRGGRSADRTSLSVLAMNSCDAMLPRLRETALARIAGRDWSHLPRRFWVSRRSERVRPMDGEAELTRALAARGFETVCFEDLSPLEQVALLARAEVMMSYHGAGFANMLFAAPEAHCIEIGTLQTCLHRWQDFMPHAIASGCRYTSLFADFNVEGAQADVEIRSRPLLPVRLDAAGRDRVLGYVDAVLGRARIDDPDWLTQVADMLARTGDDAALARLLAAHPGAVAADAGLTIHAANAMLSRGEAAAGRASMERAWEMTGDRPFLLERIVLLADEMGMPTPLEAVHAARYPDRTDLLARKRRRARRG